MGRPSSIHRCILTAADVCVVIISLNLQSYPPEFPLLARKFFKFIICQYPGTLIDETTEATYQGFNSSLTRSQRVEVFKDRAGDAGFRVMKLLKLAKGGAGILTFYSAFDCTTTQFE
ncbi:hypothetical protein A0H81_09383 [Grifola frondosa]|uniref:Uncharacterized protein n=1 Tax=Grifola frondosa TaxID=5627 RepID=A0A1C7M1T9_GRIFR|nr:hypothetical protein A0H81_09383 [Grifola frondosa]